MNITFSVVIGPNKKKDELSVGEEFQAYAGDYVVRELSAYEGNEAINELIAENKEFQNNPDAIEPLLIKKKQIEKATTLNKEPLIIDLAIFPNKVWQFLIAANEQLNSVSMEEARFLLKPSGLKRKRHIQQ